MLVRWCRLTSPNRLVPISFSCHSSSMNAARTEHPYVIEIADPVDLRPLEWIAHAATLWAANAAFDEAASRYPDSVVTMRLGARVVRRSDG